MSPWSIRFFLGCFTPMWLVIAFISRWEGDDPIPAATAALVHFVGYLVVTAVMGVADEIKAALNAPSVPMEHGP